MLFKDVYIFNFGSHFVQRRGALCEILVEGIMRIISMVICFNVYVSVNNFSVM